ncbi:permease-like cell division protein FtsX [Nonomuraea purpurea]|uniref:Permease-like cell division protein FtsX n=1 Tax=Nonomuraea purpurea TaxID=1849276 RepID=A0ABV8GU49_9ACTN
MNSPMEAKLREALQEAGATVDTGTLRPLQHTQPERRRVRVDYRLVAAAVVVVLAGAATATGLGGGPGEDSVVAANPERTPDGPTEMTVFLCTSKTKEPKCSGREATADEATEVRDTLKQSQGVKEIFFVDQSTAYDNFRRDFAHNKAVLAAVKIIDMPPQFKVKFQEGADSMKVAKTLLELPGVLSGANETIDLSSVLKQSDLSVFLCSDGSGLPNCGGKLTPGGKNSPSEIIKGGKAVTNEQRDTIRRLLETMPEVEKTVYESQTDAYESFKKAYKSNQVLLNATRVEDMPKSFRVWLKPEVKWQKTVSKLKRQPGVSNVTYNGCLAVQGALASNYGLDLPEKKLCPSGK